MEHVNRVFALETFDINDEEINVEEIMQKIRENIKKRKESGEYPENNASRLSRQSENYEYLYGWHSAENWDGVPTRWMGDEAILMINSNCLKKANLSFRAISFHHDRNLKISDEQGQDILQTVSTDPTIINIFINLKEGPNTIRFTIPEGGERPCDIPELSSDDSRCLRHSNSEYFSSRLFRKWTRHIRIKLQHRANGLHTRSPIYQYYESAPAGDRLQMGHPKQ
ncbi:hypothetical protein [Methanothrix soehngenii]|uniref:hypothetical protein n=1 Tax=Methanothrix soehngenii TaxID=2223 RepID=UPI00300C0599